MTDFVTPAAALAAASVYIAKAAYEIVLKSRNGTSEERKRCRAEELQASMNQQTDLLKEIKDSQQDTRDGVRELVTLSRRT